MVKSKQTNLMWAWIVWGVAALYVFFQFLLQSSTSVMIPELEHTFHVNALSISVLSSSFFYTYITLQIPAGILTDRFGPRKVLLSTIIICAVAAFLFAWTSSYWVAELSRLLMGVVTAPAVVCAMSLAARWFPAKQFALVVGLTEMLGMLGGAIGEIVLAHFVESPLGWQGTMMLCGVAAIGLALAVAFIVFDKPKQVEKIEPVKVSRFSFSRVLDVLSTPNIWLAGLSGGLMFTLLTAFSSFWSIPFLRHHLHFSLHEAAAGSSMVFVGAALGTPFFGWFSDWIQRRRVVMQWSSFLAGLGMLPLLFVSHLSLVWVLLLLLLTGFFAGGYVIAFAVASDLVSTQVKATALGFANMLGILLGAPLLQPLIGMVLIRTHNNYGWALSLLPLSCFLAVLLLCFMKETYGKPIEAS